MKDSKIRACWIAVVAVCFLASLVRADTLKLKDGRTIEGKYLGGTDSEITFYANGQLEHFPIANAATLTFGDTNSGVSSARAAARNTNRSSTAPVVTSSSGSQKVLVPAGTNLSVRMIDGVDSDRNSVGDTFRASLVDPLSVDGTQVAPQGTTVYGKLDQVKQAGTIKGQSELRLVLTGMVINDATYSIATGDYQVQGKSRGKQTAERTGVGAALGGLIGAIAGGGKGAAIGAGVGAGAGAATQVITHGQQVHVPSETVLNFTLQQPVSLPVSNSSAPVR